MPHSAFSIFRGSEPGSGPGDPPGGSSRLGDLGQLGGVQSWHTPAWPIAGPDDTPKATITTIPTDPRSLKQAIEDTARINGTPVFKVEGGMLGILDGRVRRSGENSWTVTDGTIGVIEGERAHARSFKGKNIIIRQDPQTGAVFYEDE